MSVSFRFPVVQSSEVIWFLFFFRFPRHEEVFFFFSPMEQILCLFLSVSLLKACCVCFFPLPYGEDIASAFFRFPFGAKHFGDSYGVWLFFAPYSFYHEEVVSFFCFLIASVSFCFP